MWRHKPDLQCCARSTEADGEQQRGAAGRKLRYFMAKQVLRETDDRLPRVRLARQRQLGQEQSEQVGLLLQRDARMLCKT